MAIENKKLKESETDLVNKLEIQTIENRNLKQQLGHTNLNMLTLAAKVSELENPDKPNKTKKPSTRYNLRTRNT